MRKEIIGLAILFFLAGLVMIFSPAGWIKASVIILGLGIILNGVYNLAKVRDVVAVDIFQKVVVIRGVLSIAIGLLAVMLPLLFAKIAISVLMYGIAIYLLIASASAGYMLYQMKEAGLNVTFYIYEIIVSVVIALVFFFMPTEVASTLVRIMGIIVCLASVGFVIYEWKTKGLVIEPESVVDDEE